MRFEPDHIYHVYNQGNNKERIFLRPSHYELFIKFTSTYILPHADMIAWCLEPQFFRMQLKAKETCAVLERQGGIFLDPLTNGFRKLLSTYSHVFNKRYYRTGALFRPKTKSRDLTKLQIQDPSSANEYYINSFNYIHQNPLKQILVNNLIDWPYSSFRFYAGECETDICNKQLADLYCGYSQEKFLNSVYTSIPEKFLPYFEI